MTSKSKFDYLDTDGKRVFFERSRRVRLPK